MKKLDFLLYLDDGYVESIYNYYYPNIIETTEGKNKNNRKRVGLAAKLFKSWPVDIDTDAEVEISNVTILESKIKPSVERKVNKILSENFQTTPVIFTDLAKVIQENGIYYFQGTFELISLTSTNGNDLLKERRYLNNPKGLVWKMKLINFDDENLNVNMALGGDKIMVNYHHLTEDIEKYKRFTFNILGKVTRFDEYNYSIKPIVIFYL